MCFMLYAGTTNPLPREEWNRDAPNLCVKALEERDAAIVTHFCCPEVQYIGSTSECGCDFPHVTLTKGEWVGYPEIEVDDPKWAADERKNREALVALLKESGEQTVELYGVWLSNDVDLATPAHVEEDISLVRILEPTFRFKERGFYRVSL